jgi:hypothetical protein
MNLSLNLLGGVVATALLFPSTTMVQAAPALGPIAKFELQYHQSKRKNMPNATNAYGKYLGSGDGTVSGRLKGKVYWDLYEDQSRDDLHRAQFVGYLETESGSRIPFDSMGFFKPRIGGGYWDLTSSVHFDCKDPHYPWLKHQTFLW